MVCRRRRAARSVLAATLIVCLVSAGAVARPAESGGRAEVVAAAPQSTRPDTGRVQRKPDIATAQTHCLALAIYHEARGEPEEGQNAVGRVILNRVASRYYPSTICEVVFQNAARLNRCQFSFACDGKSDQPGNVRAWAGAVAMAERLMCRQTCGGVAISADIVRSTHYHATYARPSWSKKLRRTGKIGSHIFYFASRR